MDDVTKTVAAAVERDWDIDDPAKDNISFVRGEPVPASMRFAEKQISIEVKPLVDPITKRSLARSTHKEVVQIDVWLNFVPVSEDRKIELMDLMQRIKDEVEGIIKAMQTALKDIRLAFPRSWQPLNNLDDEDGPYMRSVMYLVCVYEKP